VNVSLLAPCSLDTWLARGLYLGKLFFLFLSQITLLQAEFYPSIQLA